ncbi:hypothetical protein [Paenibacillus macerans]|uniref:hypothetical protein n=1 Tax=Paenibacillus macerans TaxID=44252 RepID=UPI003D3232B3
MGRRCLQRRRTSLLSIDFRKSAEIVRHRLQLVAKIPIAWSGKPYAGMQKIVTFNLMVDTDKKQLLFPDPAAKQVEVITREQTLEVRLHMKNSPDSKVGLPFTVDEYFNDNEGTKYRILQENGSPSYHRGGEVGTVIFQFEKRQYVQPLNFTLTETLEYTPQEIKIKLK